MSKNVKVKELLIGKVYTCRNKEIEYIGSANLLTDGLSTVWSKYMARYTKVHVFKDANEKIKLLWTDDVWRLKDE